MTNGKQNRNCVNFIRRQYQLSFFGKMKKTQKTKNRASNRILLPVTQHSWNFIMQVVLHFILCLSITNPINRRATQEYGNPLPLPLLYLTFTLPHRYIIHGENFMAIFTTPSVVIWFSTGTLGIFATLVYVFTMRVVIYDIRSMTIISTLLTSILFCNLCYILLWISPRSVVKIAIRI